MDLLPNELLLEIFEYCRVLPLTLVCKKFNKIISTCPSLMKKLSLVISEKTQISDVAESERDHKSVYFKFNYKISEESISLFNGFSDIRSLELMRCIVDAELFIKTLAVLAHLETLSIYTTYLKNSENIKSEPTKLKKLRRLNFRNSDEKFLNFLRDSSVESFHLGYPTQYSMKTVEEFLKSQSKLRIISCFTVSVVDDALMKVLIDLKLEKLHLESDKLDMSRIGSLELVNTSVKFLNLYGDFSQAADVNVVINFFKNLKTLELEMNNSLEPAVIIQLNQQVSQLEALSISHCSGNYFNHIQFRHLKRIKLTEGGFSVQDWSRFANRNSSIEMIKINDESTTNEVFRVICLDFHKLQHLEVFYDPQRLTSSILDFICSTEFPKNIKFLKIIQRNSSAETFLFLSEAHKTFLDKNYGFKFIFN